MSRMFQAAGWILWILTITPLGFLCVAQWRSSEASQNHMVGTISDSFGRIERKLDLAKSRHDSLPEVLERYQKEIKALLSALPRSEISDADGLRQTNAVTPQSAAAEPKDVGDLHVDEVALLPQGVSADEILGKEIEEILSDERVNPRKRKLNRIESAKFVLELRRAQGVLKVVESEIALDVAREIENLRKRMAYVEYAPGERYETIKGVMTAAELVNGRTRMFYFYPEQFPGIYEKKEQKAAITEAAARRLVSIIGR